MTDYSELVRDLRTYSYKHSIGEAAADAIEALQAECDLHQREHERNAEIVLHHMSPERESEAARLTADRDHWKARAERAEAVVKKAKFVRDSWVDDLTDDEDLAWHISHLIGAIEDQEGEQG